MAASTLAAPSKAVVASVENLMAAVAVRWDYDDRDAPWRRC